MENIFSSVRAKQPSPNALQFKHNLKIIAISKYLKPVGNSSYEEDDRVIAGDFLSKPKAKKNLKIPLIPDFSTKDINLGDIEINVLYYIAGYILSRISKYNIVCKLCLNSAGSLTYDPISKCTKFVQLKCFRRNMLFLSITEHLNIFTRWKLLSGNIFHT